MRRSITISLLPLVFAACVSAAEPIRPVATHVGGTTPKSLKAVGDPSFDAREAGSHLPTIYIPYAPGQPIPHGWKLERVTIPVRETRTKTVCEKQIVRIPKQVPCMLSKTIRFPTEVYKTYIKFKEITVEDGTLKRHEDAPEADLDDLDLDEDEDETVAVSFNSAGNATGDGRKEPSDDATQVGHESKPRAQPNRPARPGYEWVPVTKVRKKRVAMQVPVQKLVEVDEGCWKEIVVHVPAHICSKSCRHDARSSPPSGENGEPTGTMPIIRRVWEPRIVRREVTVTETRDVTIDETYTDYVEQPAANPDIAPDIAPDSAPDIAPDTAPDIAPEVMVTTDRTVRIPQYVTKAERHYLTKTVKVPGFKTVYETVKKTVQREVPYEVVRTCEKLILVPIDFRAIPPSLLAEPPRQLEDVAPGESLPPIGQPTDILPLPNIP